MNTTSSPKQGRPGNDQTSEEGIDESIPVHHREENITEGGEFLDDAIRTEDLVERTDKNRSQKVSYKHLF